MPRVIRFFNIVVIPVLLYSCILTTEEENFVEIDPITDPDNVAFVTYSYDNKVYFPIKDTLWVSNQLFMEFEGGSVYEFEVMINNAVFKPFGNTRGPVIISKDALSNTNNIIYITQRVKSGTGSMADKLNVEYAEFRYQFVLTRDNSPAFVPQIQGISFEDGSVKVEWNKFLRSDFQYYRIVKSVRTFTGSKQYRSFDFNSRHQNAFIDTTYVGGSVNYQLLVNNGGEMTSAPYAFDYTFKPSVTLTKTGDNFNLSFTLPPFSDNVKFYKTTFYNRNPFDNTQVITTMEVNPAKLSMDIAGPVTFGNPMKYEISPTAKVEKVELGDQTLSTGFVHYGTKLKYYKGWYEHDINSNIYFCYVYKDGNGTMYKIDDATFEAIDSVSFPGGPILFTNHHSLIISADGNHHYYLTGTNALKFNPSNLTVTATTAFSSISSPPNISFENKGTTVTNNNFIFFSGSYSGAFPCVVDMNTNTKLFAATDRSVPGHLSPDGMFLAIGQQAYKYTGSTYAYDHTLPYESVTYLQFINNNPSHLLINTPTSIIIYDCQTKTELFSTPARFDYNQIVFDQASSKVAGVDFGQKIFDLPTRTIKSVPVNPLYAFFSGGVFFTTQPQDGYRYALKDY